jgi:predicted Zn-ribbon and HTH transcriptional regulator
MSEDQWKTRKILLQEMIERSVNGVDLKFAFKELKYESKSQLITDLEFISKGLAKEERQVLVSPAECSLCNYKFGFKDQKITIPSKCPKCKKQLIIWPLVKID